MAFARLTGHRRLTCHSNPPAISSLLSDLTRVRSGPTCVRQLADWGANVIKIENPDTAGSDMGGSREGSDFQNLHRNKRSMILNLKDPEGVAIFKKMAETADVVVENYRPDVTFRLGIDYETLRALNPRIVYASISASARMARWRGVRQPDRAGHGRVNVDHRRAGRRPDTGRHPNRRSDR